MIRIDLYTKSAMTPDQLQQRLAQRATKVPAKGKFTKAARSNWKKEI